MNLLDFKGTVDRKMIAISEDVPTQIERKMKTFEIRES